MRGWMELSSGPLAFALSGELFFYEDLVIAADDVTPVDPSSIGTQRWCCNLSKQHSRLLMVTTGAAAGCGSPWRPARN